MPKHDSYPEVPLGSGVYVSHDGWHYTLHAPRTANAIYLDEEQLRKLLAYVVRVKEWQEKDAAEAEKLDARKRETREGF